MGGSKWSRKYYLKTVKQPQPPYTNEEVPHWWPQWLRKYLTTVSRESLYGLYSHIIEVPKDPTLTLEQTKQLGSKQSLQDISDAGGLETYFKYEIEAHPELDIEEIKRIYMENEELECLSIMIGNNGCTFSYLCDLRTGRIYHHDLDDRGTGDINYHRKYLE